MFGKPRFALQLAMLAGLSTPVAFAAQPDAPSASGGVKVSVQDLETVDALEAFGAPNLCPSVEPSPPRVELTATSRIPEWRPLGSTQLVVNPTDVIDGWTGQRAEIQAFLTDAQVEHQALVAKTGLPFADGVTPILWIHRDTSVGTVNQVVRQAEALGVGAFRVMLGVVPVSRSGPVSLPDNELAQATITTWNDLWGRERQAAKEALWRQLFVACPALKLPAISIDMSPAAKRCQTTREELVPVALASCGPEVTARLQTVIEVPTLVGTPAMGHPATISGKRIRARSDQVWSDIADRVAKHGSLNLVTR